MVIESDNANKENETELPLDASALDYQVIIQDKEQLKSNYMPFVKNGAIFIATEKQYQLNDLLTVSIQLFDNPEEYIIRGKTVWINPKFAQDNRPQGIGIQFLNKESRILRDKIENMLAGSSDKANSSSTM